MLIHPVRTLTGRVEVPGDKSISHRYTLLGALAQGHTRILNFSDSRDCSSTLGCIGALGVQTHREGSRVDIHSPGWTAFRAPERVLDAGNSGTTIRLLSALLACRPMMSTIRGDESLNGRPMRRIIIPLTQMGAEIRAQADEYPPLTITGADLEGIRYVLPVASAQVKSCVLLAGLTALGTTTVVEPVPSRDHTERALPLFGASLTSRDSELSVTGRRPLHGAEVRVPGDFSSAVFFILAGLLVPGAEVEIPNVGVNPTRTRLLSLLSESGARLDRERPRECSGEPVADLRVRFSPAALDSFPTDIETELVPNLIDEIPALAVFGTQTRNGLRVHGAGELRKKESDRIHSIVVNLRSLGAEVEELEDGFRVAPRQRLLGGRVRTFGDHRIAMAFSLAGLVAEGPVELDDPDCAAVSFPGFYRELRSISC